MPARDIKAGAAYVELFLRDNRFVRGLRTAERRLRAMGQRFTAVGGRMIAVGAGLLAPLLAAAKGFAAMGDQLDKMSSRVGVSVEFLSALGHAAQLGGADIETMEKGIRRLQRSALDASRGLSTQVEAFDQLGVSVKRADGQLKRTEALFMETITALSKIENETQKAALAQMIFGRSGTMLLPMLRDGRQGMVGMMEEAKRLGIVMSTEGAAAAAVFTDQMTRMGAVFKRVVFYVGAAIAGPLGDLSERITKAGKAIGEFINRNRALIVMLLKIAGVMLAAGGILVTLGIAFGSLAAIISGVLAAIGAVVVVAKLLLAGMAALLSPIGLVTAALVGLGAYLLKVSGAGGAALEWLAEKFTALWKSAREAFRGIADALAAGDLKLAAQVLWLSLKVEFAKGINALREYWIGFKLVFMRVWTDAVYGLAAIFAKGVAILQDIWVRFSSGVITAWKTAEQKIAEGIGYIIAKMKGLEPEEVIEEVRKDYQRQTRGREATRQKRLEAIEEQRRGTLEGLEEERRRRNRERAGRYGEQLSRQQEQLNKLIRERDRAIAEASRAAEEARAGPGLQQRIEEALAGLGDLEAITGPRAEAAGTFSALAAGRLGASTWHQRTAKATEETAKATEETAKNTAKIEKRGRFERGIAVI